MLLLTVSTFLRLTLIVVIVIEIDIYIYIDAVFLRKSSYPYIIPL